METVALYLGELVLLVVAYLYISDRKKNEAAQKECSDNINKILTEIAVMKNDITYIRNG